MAEKWTVMVYMVAGDDAELDAHAVRDLLEMQRAPINGTVNVLVQIDRFWPELPQRYRIQQGQATLRMPDVTAVRVVAGTERREGNMGTREMLFEFMDWARRQDVTANRFFLILWGHAYGLGFGRDHGDPLTLEDLSLALAKFRESRVAETPLAADYWPAPGESTGPKLDLLGANACAMSYVEAAFELSGSVDYMVASQIAVPFAGWPYEAILGHIQSYTTPADLGKIVVTRYVNHFNASLAGDQVGMTLLNLAGAKTLKVRLGAMATALDAAILKEDPKLGDRLGHVRSAFLATAAGDVRPLIDLYDLCQKLEDLGQDLERIEKCSKRDACKDTVTSLLTLRTNAKDLRMFLEPSTNQVAGEMEMQQMPPRAVAEAELIVHHGRHPDLDGLHGVGIFAPFVTDERDLQRLGLMDDRAEKGRSAYEDLALVTDLKWPELVYDRLAIGLPAEVLIGVEGSGATSLEERSAVAQMLSGIDATFAMLDRRLEAARLVAVPVTAKPLTAPVTPSGPDHIAAPPETATLGRFGTLRLLPQEDLEQIIGRAKPTPAPAPPPAPPPAKKAEAAIAPEPELTDAPIATQVKAVVASLAGLETMIAEVERAVRRTVTNGSFGLGPSALTGGGLGKRDLGKRDLGKRDLGKRDLGKRDLGKRDLGKRDLGLVGLNVASPFGLEPSPALIMEGLFEQVGGALSRLEDAAVGLELTVVMALAGQTTFVGLEPDEKRDRTQELVRRAFRMLAEASTDARRTLRRVLAHPVYGFGPSADGVSAEDRRELARSSGLNGDELRLL